MIYDLIDIFNLTETENGALTHVSTGSDCLDLFSTAGALRNAEEQTILSRFLRAYSEDADLAMKILFYARDIRGGMGERRFFRTVLRWLAENEPASLKKNIARVAEFGRWDDLLCLLDTGCAQAVLSHLRQQLHRDLTALEEGGEVSLLAKWLPSVNASNADTVGAAKKIARYLGMTDAAYRKTLVKLRSHIRIIENSLRTRDYTFDYAKQPSRAMMKYRKAFIRNDATRYSDFLEQVAQGKKTMHTAALTPYDIIRPCFSYNARFGTVDEQERIALNTTWNAQEDFTGGENALVVADGSGSMYCDNNTPICTAMSLAIYFAERNTGPFHNHFITFSNRPQMVEIKGDDIMAKVRYCSDFNEVANTDLEKVFQLILQAAVKNNIPQEQMPASLYIISDMEFDYCIENADMTNYQNAKRTFAACGYELPRVVFWNVASRNRQQPVTKNEQGTILVSGSSPRVFQMLRSDCLDPYAFMLEVLGNERYADICA